MNFSGKSGLQGWLRTTWLPYLERIPGTLKEKFIEELSEMYILNNPADSDGTIHVSMVRLEVEAIKELPFEKTLI